MAEEPEQQDFRLALAQKRFLFTSNDIPGVDKAKLQAEILEVIAAENMAPFYEHICMQLGWPADATQLSSMKAANQKQLEELDAKVKDAEENLGETEVRDAMHAKAEYLGKIGDQEAAAKAYQETESKTASGGSKADMVFSQIRLAILYEDWHGVKKLLSKAKQICDAGGDWEHKNKLKVYEAVFAMYTRDFKRAAERFLESMATFTTSELFSYSRCINYAVIMSLVSLDRVTLKAKVVESPEVLSVIGQTPELASILNALYNCNYKEFFQAFVPVMDLLRCDIYLRPHLRYYMREVRLVAYSQFLESYKSVTLESMAAAFDVGVPFLDQEVSDLIVAGRLGAQIDKVAGIIESKRPDVKNQMYQDAIKKGDQLLSHIQKLSRVIDVE